MIRRKSALILYSMENWNKPDKGETEGLQRSNYVWNKILRRRGFRLYKASIRWFKNGHFTKFREHLPETGWRDIKKPMLPTFVHDKTYTVDLKTGEPVIEHELAKTELNKKVPFYNYLQFTQLVENKLNQAALFYKFMPRTTLWLPGDKIKNPSGQNIVLKQLFGSGGHRVWIRTRKNINIEDVMLQQQFIKATKKGVLRDIRLTFIGDKPMYAYYRIAKPGNLFTNVHQGAHMEFEKLSRIKSLIKYALQVAAPLRIFPKKVYSLDFLIDAKTSKPFLVEINSKPGYENFSTDTLERYFTELNRHFLE